MLAVCQTLNSSDFEADATCKKAEVMSHIWFDELSLLGPRGPSALIRHWRSGCQPPTSPTPLCRSVVSSALIWVERSTQR